MAVQFKSYAFNDSIWVDINQVYEKIPFINIENKQKYIIKAREYNKSVANWFDDYKKELKCSKCNESRWWVLDFHHLNKVLKIPNRFENLHSVQH